MATDTTNNQRKRKRKIYNDFGKCKCLMMYDGGKLK